LHLPTWIRQGCERQLRALPQTVEHGDK